MIRKSQLLTLPNELLEFILSLVCLQNARDIHPCRLTCRTLNTVIARSARMQYLERAALLGVYDPLVEDATAPTVSERMAELCAWDDAWRNVGDILKQREPDARIESPDVYIYDGLHPIRHHPSSTTNTFSDLGSSSQCARPPTRARDTLTSTYTCARVSTQQATCPGRATKTSIVKSTGAGRRSRCRYGACTFLWCRLR